MSVPFWTIWVRSNARGYFCAAPARVGNRAALLNVESRRFANSVVEDRRQSERLRWARLHSNPAPRCRRHCTRDWRGIRSRCPTPWPGTAGNLNMRSWSSRDSQRPGDKTDIAQRPEQMRSLKIKSRQVRTAPLSSFPPIFRPNSASRVRILCWNEIIESGRARTIPS
jgi:hypothetical protein